MKTPNNVRRMFPTWESFLAVAKKPATIPHAASETNSHAFSLTHSYAEAIGLAERGWVEGVSLADREFSAIKAQMPKGDDFSATFSESGDEVDVGLFLEGEPEHMIEYHMEPRNRPVVKLVVSVSYSCGIPTETVFRRGAAIMAAVDGLEAAGVRCEIVADFSARSGVNTYTDQVVVKSAESQLDRDRVIFALCHPSMLRRLCLRMSEVNGRDEWIARGGSGYGSPINPEPEPGAAVIPCMEYGDKRWASTESAVAEVKAIIASLS